MALLRKVVGEELEGYGRTAGNSQIVSTRQDQTSLAGQKFVTSARYPFVSHEMLTGIGMCG